MSGEPSEPPASNTRSAINAVFLFFVVGAILFAAYTGRMQAVTDASFEAAKSAVTLAIGLIGIMALWLGLVRVLEAGGFMYTLAKALRPVMVRLFPDVPPLHPAMGAMILNISANMLGLGNAATPFGIKAMAELDRLNPLKGTATNAMCLFLALNTSSVALFPLGVIGVRAAANATDPAGIWLPTLLSTIASTAVGIVVAVLLARRDSNYAQLSKKQPLEESSSEGAVLETLPTSTEYSHLLVPVGRGSKALAMLGGLAFAGAMGLGVADHGFAFFDSNFVSFWLMPALMLAIVLYGLGRGVKVYEAVTEGAKQGFDIAVRIIPFLVAILVAIGMFRASGAMELLTGWIAPLSHPIGMPPDTLPMALIRPLSGSGAFGIMSELIQREPDSYSAFVAMTMMGSTETTFYVLAVYFGAVGVTRLRHALVAALLADVTGIVCACLTSAFFWSPPL
ncbi:MAG: hypothetical protein KDD69_01910 [Bdellovibrionales bacterium]|nr:hypothetical protein [Bdellovibrionales bacterium]